MDEFDHSFLGSSTLADQVHRTLAFVRVSVPVSLIYTGNGEKLWRKYEDVHIYVLGGGTDVSQLGLAVLRR